jgi:hypothetical protein
MNWRNVDPQAWLLCAKWIADVMNHTSEKSLKWRPPLQVLTGQTIDISILLCFLFWDVVYVSRYNDQQYKGQIGSQKSSEIRGRFVGFAWSVGHALTFKVLTDDTKKVICRSRVRLAKDGENNLKLDVEAGAVPERIYIRSKRDKEGDDVILPTIDLTNNPFDIDQTDPEEGETEEGESTDPMDDPPLSEQPVVETVEEDEDEPERPTTKESTKFDTDFLRTDNPTQPSLPPEEMIDRTFLMPPAEDGSRVRAKIIQHINEHKDELATHPEVIRFKCLIDNKYEEVIAYNDIIDYIEQDDTWDGVWKFREILDHKGPIKPSDKEYKGSRFNLQVLWETGEITWEPLTMTQRDGVYEADPVTVAIYADKHKLIDTPGWKLPGLRKRAKTQKRLIRFANQAKLHSFRTKPVYMYGFLVPRNHEQAMEFDKNNGNTKWKDAEDKELSQIDEYETFIDKGKGY